MLEDQHAKGSVIPISLTRLGSASCRSYCRGSRSGSVVQGWNAPNADRTVQTPFRLTQEIRSRAYRNSNVLGLGRAPSRRKPATPLSWNSGVLTMLDRARQVRSDHPWPPGSTLMATPWRNCSLERFYFAYLTRSRTEQHDGLLSAQHGARWERVTRRNCVRLRRARTHGTLP